MKKDNILQTKQDFVCIFSVDKAIPVGMPGTDNYPLVLPDGRGEVGRTSLTHKIRSRLADYGETIFVTPDGVKQDSYQTQYERYRKEISNDPKQWQKVWKAKNHKEVIKQAAKKYTDIRWFSNIFSDKSKHTQFSSHAPISLSHAVSYDPVVIRELPITRCIAGSHPKNEGEHSDTMGGSYRYIDFGLYSFHGTIDVSPAERFGFTEDDVALFKNCLKTLFVNDQSNARPASSMTMEKIYWWNHTCRYGNVNSYDVHHSVHVKLKDGITIPQSIDDYHIWVDHVDRLNDPEEISTY